MDPSAGGDRIPRSESAGGTFPAARGYALSGKIMLSAIVILFSVVLFVLFLHLYARWYVLRRTASLRRRRRPRPLVFAAEGPATSAAASRGLDAETLKHIPVHDFSLAESEAGEVPAAATECAVCLNEFEDGEKVRTLPPCGHGFHVECIDMWFYSHATCPLCRSAVEAVELTTPEATTAPSPPPDLCSSCRHVEAGGSSSARSVELSVELPARRGEGLYRGWDEEVSSPGGALKSPGGRILSLKRLLSRDSRLYRGGGSSAVEPDLERGEGATAAVAVALNEW